VYFLNLNALTMELQERPLTDRETFPYALGWILLWLFPFPAVDNVFDYSLDVIAYVFEAGGFIWLYRINGSRNGIGFLGRYFSINCRELVDYPLVGIPFVILIAVVFAVFAFATDFAPPDWLTDGFMVPFAIILLSVSLGVTVSRMKTVARAWPVNIPPPLEAFLENAEEIRLESAPQGNSLDDIS